jgi:hypothetical protein
MAHLRNQMVHGDRESARRAAADLVVLLDGNGYRIQVEVELRGSDFARDADFARRMAEALCAASGSTAAPCPVADEAVVLDLTEEQPSPAAYLESHLRGRVRRVPPDVLARFPVAVGAVVASAAVAAGLAALPAAGIVAVGALGSSIAPLVARLLVEWVRQHQDSGREVVLLVDEQTAASGLADGEGLRVAAYPPRCG